MTRAATSGAITVAWLKRRRACGRQVRLFRDLFGESAALTRENALRAARSGLSIQWLAERLLAGEALDAYHEAETSAACAYFGAGDRETAVIAYREAKAVLLCDALGLP